MGALISGGVSSTNSSVSGIVGDASKAYTQIGIARNFDGLFILPDSITYTSIISNGIDVDIEVPAMSLSLNDTLTNGVRTLTLSLLTPVDLSAKLIGRATGDKLHLYKSVGGLLRPIFDGAISLAQPNGGNYLISATAENQPLETNSFDIKDILYTSVSNGKTRYRIPANLAITAGSFLTINSASLLANSVATYISLGQSFTEFSNG